MATKTETTPKKSTSVAAKANTDVAINPLLADLEDEAAVDQQSFSQDMLIIPRIKVLQDLSPEIKSGKAEYVEGARPGLFFNEVNGALDERIIFTPSLFNVRYIAWRPRKAGGGLVDPNLTREEADQNFQQEGIGLWTGMMTPQGQQDPVRVEVIQTPEFIGVARGHNWMMPVALSMPSTKVKAARKINTAIDVKRLQGRNGPFRPAMPNHQFVLTTGIESGAENEWWGIMVQHLGCYGDPENDKADQLDINLILEAKATKKRFDEGTAIVDDSTLEQ